MMIAGQHCRQNKTNTRTSTGGEVEQQDEGHARHGGILLQGDTAPGGATVRPQVFPPVIVAAIGYRNGRKATGATGTTSPSPRQPQQEQNDDNRQRDLC